MSSWASCLGAVALVLVPMHKARAQNGGDAVVTVRATEPDIAVLRVLDYTRDAQSLPGLRVIHTTYTVVPECTAPCSFAAPSGPFIMMVSGTKYETKQETVSLRPGDNRFLVTPGHALVHQAGLGFVVLGLGTVLFGAFSATSRAGRDLGIGMVLGGVTSVAIGIPLAALGGTRIEPDR
jgi:hypothetical protein